MFVANQSINSWAICWLFDPSRKNKFPLVKPIVTCRHYYYTKCFDGGLSLHSVAVNNHLSQPKRLIYWYIWVFFYHFDVCITTYMFTNVAFLWFFIWNLQLPYWDVQISQIILVPDVFFIIKHSAWAFYNLRYEAGSQEL